MLRGPARLPFSRRWLSQPVHNEFVAGARAPAGDAPLLAMYDAAGAAYEVLNSAEMRTRWPHLRVPESTIGLWDPAGGYSEPAEYVPALRQRVFEMGGEIRENT